MENVRVVQGFQTFYNLDENAPNVVLAEVRLLLLMSSDLLKEVSIVCVFHYDADWTNESH